MAEMHVAIDGQVNAYGGRVADFSGAYSFSLFDAPGVVAANNFLSIFNPAGSGKLVIGGSAGISGFVVTGTPTPPLASLRLRRITAASAGTLQAVGNIAKFVSTDANPVAEIRTGNPTVTAGAGVFCFPPGVNTSFDASRHQILPVQGFGPLVFAPGEGAVFQTASGDTEQLWNIDIAWAEQPI